MDQAQGCLRSHLAAHNAAGCEQHGLDAAGELGEGGRVAQHIEAAGVLRGRPYEPRHDHGRLRRLRPLETLLLRRGGGLLLLLIPAAAGARRLAVAAGGVQQAAASGGGGAAGLSEMILGVIPGVRRKGGHRAALQGGATGRMHRLLQGDQR